MEEQTETDVGSWPGATAAITLFADDLPAARRFYEDVFGLPVHYEDEHSVVFEFGQTLVNLLAADQAPSLVEPAAVAGPEAGVRFQFTLAVEDVDAKCSDLEKHGVRLLNGPQDRPWGIRTASFLDPAGHIWEIAN